MYILYNFLFLFCIKSIAFQSLAFNHERNLRSVAASAALATEECASSVEVSIIRLNASMPMVREHNIPCSCWPFLRWWEFMSWIHRTWFSVTELIAIEKKRNHNLSDVFRELTFKLGNFQQKNPFFFFSKETHSSGEGSQGKKEEHPYIHHPSL